MTKVFISYGREDQKAAERLCAELQNMGIDVWFDRISLRAGERWKTSIVKAIREVDSVVILLSKHSASRRGFLNKEIREALDVLDEQPENKPFLIPARLDECELSHFALSELHWIDMFPDWHNGVREIKKSLDIMVDAPPPSDRKVRVFLEITLRTTNDLHELAARISQSPHVISVDLTVGPIDMIIIMEATNPQHLYDALEEFHRKPEFRKATMKTTTMLSLRSFYK
jgi:hypothetical protein